MAQQNSAAGPWAPATESLAVHIGFYFFGVKRVPQYQARGGGMFRRQPMPRVPPRFQDSTAEVRSSIYTRLCHSAVAEKSDVFIEEKLMTGNRGELPKEGEEN